jgi:hypothetical protein
MSVVCSLRHKKHRQKDKSLALIVTHTDTKQTHTQTKKKLLIKERTERNHNVRSVTANQHQNNSRRLQAARQNRSSENKVVKYSTARNALVGRC